MQRQIDVDGEHFHDDDTNRPLDRDEAQGDDESSSEDEGHEIMEQQPAVILKKLFYFLSHIFRIQQTSNQFQSK